MTKNIQMATKGSKYLYLFVYYKCCLFKKSVYWFYNAFLHLLVSKSFITSLISLFKYKLFRNIIVFNLYLPSGPRPFPVLGVFVCVDVLRPSQQLRSCRAGQLPTNTVPEF